MKPVAERQRASYVTLAVPVHLPTNQTRNRYVPTQRASTIRLRTSLFQEAAEIVDREYASDL